ncbi:MAG: HTH domain-containing protein [Bacilli bacterium]
MDKKIYYNELFSIYKGLFTSTQVNYFTAYYEEDLSLSEIAENYNVSRNAIFNCINTLEKKLVYYEDVLKIVQKNKRLEKLINSYNNPIFIKEIEEIIND